MASTSRIRNIKMVLHQGAVLPQLRGARIHHDQTDQCLGRVLHAGELGGNSPISRTNFLEHRQSQSVAQRLQRLRKQVQIHRGVIRVADHQRDLLQVQVDPVPVQSQRNDIPGMRSL